MPALVQIMAWHHPGDKPLSVPMMVSLLTHICVTRPQWVNSLAPGESGNHMKGFIFKDTYMVSLSCNPTENIFTHWPLTERYRSKFTSVFLKNSFCKLISWTALQKMQNLGSPNGLPMVEGWVVRQSIICWDHASSKKWSTWTKRGPHFTKAQWTFDISASVESSLHFHSKTFSAKPKESIGRQTDHLW